MKYFHILKEAQRLGKCWQVITVKVKSTAAFFLSGRSSVHLLLGVLDSTTYHCNDLARENRIRKCRLLTLVLINIMHRSY